MSEWARRCARDGCNTWQRFESDLENTWVDVLLNDPDEPVVIHLCTIDCLTHWAATNSTPTEAWECP